MISGITYDTNFPRVDRERKGVSTMAAKKKKAATKKTAKKKKK